MFLYSSKKLNIEKTPYSLTIIIHTHTMKLRNRIIHSDTDLLILQEHTKNHSQKLVKMKSSIRSSKSDGNLYTREYDEQTKNRVYELERIIHGLPITQKCQ